MIRNGEKFPKNYLLFCINSIPVFEFVSEKPDQYETKF